MDFISFLVEYGQELLVLGEIGGMYVLSLFGHYRAAAAMGVSTALTVVLGW